LIPQTLAEGDDALDVRVFSQEAVAPLTIVLARAIGLITMIDEGKTDHKIISVAIGDPEFKDYDKTDALAPHRLSVLRKFFEDYKQLEDKTVEANEIAPAKKPIRSSRMPCFAIVNSEGTDFSLLSAGWAR
jgi:inorganic pyrophosphatase